MFVYMYIETFIDTNIHNVLRVCWCLSLYKCVCIYNMYVHLYVRNMYMCVSPLQAFPSCKTYVFGLSAHGCKWSELYCRH